MKRWGLILVALSVQSAVTTDDFDQKISRTINLMKISLQNWEHPAPPLQPPPNENSMPAKPPAATTQHPLQQRSLIEYCRRLRKPKIQFGGCSPTFLVCEPSAIRFEHCPTGQVFVDEECRPATEQPTCFDSSFNQLNHATEKLSSDTGFCGTSSPQGFIHLAADSNECSRQALICAGLAGVLTLSCPKGSALRAHDLSCGPAAQLCHFVHKAQVQPIKSHLELIHCHEHMKAGGQTTSIAMSTNGRRCRDWFVTCASPEKDFVFCGPNSLFDEEKGRCRPTRPNDNCPAIFNCRGFEWRIIPFGLCRPEFIYCRGLTPVQFQCRPEFVLKDDKCVMKKHVHEECEPTPGERPPCAADERKADSANCTRFYQCDPKADGLLGWLHYECPKGEGYDPHLGDCSTDYKCGEDCKDGKSFAVTCYEYFRCHNGRYRSATCPSKSRFSTEEDRCVFDPKCRHRDEQETEDEKSAEEECVENSFVKSKDCISYGVCKDSILHWKPCQLPSGKLHPHCPDCSQEQHPASSAESPPTNPDEESNFSPTECTDGAVVIGKNECSKFMKCYAGHWLMVNCPNEKFFSLKTQACTAAECESSGVFIPSPPGSESLPDLKPPPTASKEKCKDVNCCDAESLKLPIPTDCQRFRECDPQTNRYREMQCPYNEHFDESRQECVEGKNCKDEETAECPAGALQTMPKCGYARLCLEGKWNMVRCKEQMAFLNGKCSNTVSCEHAESETTVGDECHDGETKNHPFSCNKYLVCDHGVFIERICSYGALFNPKSQRCDLNYECDYENQPKCYEGQLKANRQNCHSFLRCVEGVYVEEICPKERVFDDELKNCKKGKCDKSAEDDDSEDEDQSKDHESDEPKTKHHQSQDRSHERPDSGKPAGSSSEKCTEAVDSSGYRRDRNNCAKFYQCANGVWIPKDCPSGTVFNTPLAVCDWPRNVPGCE